MDRELSSLSHRYAMALQKHLRHDARASLRPAQQLGRAATALGLETLDVARIHEAAIATLPSSHKRGRHLKRAENFFAEAITSIEGTHPTALKTNARLRQLTKALGRRTADLATSGRHLKRGVRQRQLVERALRTSAAHYAQLVKESQRLQKHLRHLTHEILTTQETERTSISQKLRDEIAQTLLGIHVRLLALKQEATVNTVGLKKEIAGTQQLVKQSVKTMSRFAREIGKQHGT